jgi:hypothetical protein
LGEDVRSVFFHWLVHKIFSLSKVFAELFTKSDPPEAFLYSNANGGESQDGLKIPRDSHFRIIKMTTGKIGFLIEFQKSYTITLAKLYYNFYLFRIRKFFWPIGKKIIKQADFQFQPGTDTIPDSWGRCVFLCFYLSQTK